MRVGRLTNIRESHTLHLLVEDLPRCLSAYFYLVLEYNDYTIDDLISRTRWMTDEEQFAKTKYRLCLGRGGPPLFCAAASPCTSHSASFTLQHPSISRHSLWTHLDTDAQYCSNPLPPTKNNGFSKPHPVDNHPLSSAYLAVRCYYIYTARRRWARRRQYMWQVLCELFHSGRRLKDVSRPMFTE